VRRFRWNPEKNEALKAERGISFERIVLAIADGDVLDVLRHPKEGRYPDQLILVVAVEGYAYLVPYVEEADGKATREYLSQGDT